MEENKKVNEQIKKMQTNSEAKAQSPKAEATQANEKKETAPRINTKPQEAKIEKNTGYIYSLFFIKMKHQRKCCYHHQLILVNKERLIIESIKTCQY